MWSGYKGHLTLLRGFDNNYSPQDDCYWEHNGEFPSSLRWSFKHVNKFNHFLFTVWKLECFLTTNKRGEHSLQMWVWDTKEHCVRAHKIIVRALKMGGFGKGGSGFWLGRYYTPL